MESTQTGDQEEAALACDKGQCIVSWVRVSSGGSRSLWSAEVNDQGVLAPVTTSSNWNNAIHLRALALGGGRKLHIMELSGSAGDYNYYGLSTNGAGVLDVTPSILAGRISDPPGAGCRFLDNEFFCAFFQRPGTFNDLFFRKLDANGVALGAGPQELQSGDNHLAGLSLVPLGDRFVITWDDRNSSNFRPYAAIVSTSGTILNERIPISALNSEEGESASTEGPGVALFAWTLLAASPSVSFAQIDGTGIVQSLPLSWTEARSPSLSWHANRLLVAVERTQASGAQLEVHEVAWTPPYATQLLLAIPDARDPILQRIDDDTALLAFRQTVSGGDERVFVTRVALTVPEPPPLPDGGMDPPDAGMDPEEEGGGGEEEDPLHGGSGALHPGFTVGCGCDAAAASVLPFSGCLVLLWRRAMKGARNR